MSKKQRKELDAAIDRSYNRQCHGTSISIMDIPKLFDEVAKEVEAGKDLDESVADAIMRFNQS